MRMRKAGSMGRIIRKGERGRNLGKREYELQFMDGGS
jgi:hypothetical protein